MDKKTEDTYLSLAAPSEGVYKEKGSKFLAFAFPIASEEEAKTHLQFLRKKYYDARHYCFAYRLFYPHECVRTSDDGEPAHTAGDPILGQLRSRALNNVLIVVVRYFGGTKLGAGGLIHAYRTAAADALDHAFVVTKMVESTLRIEFDYLLSNDVMKILKHSSVSILEQGWESTSYIRFSVRKSVVENLKMEFQKLVSVKVIEE